MNAYIVRSTGTLTIKNGTHIPDFFAAKEL